MKKIPDFKTDKEAEDFLDQDLTDYLDMRNFQKVNFEVLPKDKNVNLRVSDSLLSAVKKKAKKRGISYQKYIRLVIEKSLATF